MNDKNFSHNKGDKQFRGIVSYYINKNGEVDKGTREFNSYKDYNDFVSNKKLFDNMNFFNFNPFNDFLQLFGRNSFRNEENLIGSSNKSNNSIEKYEKERRDIMIEKRNLSNKLEKLKEYKEFFLNEKGKESILQEIEKDIKEIEEKLK